MPAIAPRPTTYAAPGRPVQGPPQNVRQMQTQVTQTMQAMQSTVPPSGLGRAVKIGVVAALLTGLGYVGFKFVRKRMRRGKR